MENESFIVDARSPNGEYSVFFEDDGRTGYMYLCGIGEDGSVLGIIDHLWIYNKISPSIEEYNEVKIEWTQDSKRVALIVDKECWGVMDLKNERKIDAEFENDTVYPLRGRFFRYGIRKKEGLELNIEVKLKHIIGNEIILGVPGIWEDNSQLRKELAGLEDGYAFGGKVLLKIKDGTSFEANLVPREEDIVEQFMFFGREKFNEDFLEELDKHKSILYIRKRKGNKEDYIELLKLGKLLLGVGGLGIKVQTSTIAYSKESWIDISNFDFIYDETEDDYDDHVHLYNTIINLVQLDIGYTSLGMKSFGHPDIMLSLDEDPDMATVITNQLNMYQITGDREILDGHTFSLTDDSQWYRFNFSDDFRFSQDDDRFNPFGIFKMERVDRNDYV